MKLSEKLTTLLAAGMLLVTPAFLSAAGQVPSQKTLDQKVLHTLLMQPYYGVFDNISFRVDGSKVTLFGEVRDPVTKRDAESAVKHVEGVTAVDDQIEVLPLSTFDDQIRLRTLRAIYGYGPLNRYALGTHNPIHIIVKNGHVTLMGEVDNEMDRQIAYQRAMGVFGAFSVTNDLHVRNKS